MLLKLSAHLI
ncbi:hypothetical protein MJO29_010387 [Puccinia striiformis f. sp. tritici]|nr:hypothetical protein MJO29_010387 [Puccinia striiformis f. sp. tritici]